MRLGVHLLHHLRVRRGRRRSGGGERGPALVAGQGALAVWARAQRAESRPAPPSLRRASDKCQREKRKTINGDDLLWAMQTLGFEEYIEPLKVYLAKYREVRGERGSSGGRAAAVCPAGCGAGSPPLRCAAPD